MPPERILASDVKADRLEHLHKLHGIRTTTDNHLLLRESDVLVLAVKPQAIDKVLTEVGADLRPDQLVVSVAAGVPIAALEARLPAGRARRAFDAEHARDGPGGGDGHRRQERTPARTTCASRASSSRRWVASSSSTRGCSTR